MVTATPAGALPDDPDRDRAAGFPDAARAGARGVRHRGPAALALRPARRRPAPLAQRAARRKPAGARVSRHARPRRRRRRARAHAARALDRALRDQRPALREGPRRRPRGRLGRARRAQRPDRAASPSTPRAPGADGDLLAARRRHPGRGATSCRTAGARRARGGRSGRARVIFYAPVREAAEDEDAVDWTALLRDVNATDDASTESETFLTVVPGNPLRFAVGANGGGGYNAWITNTGGRAVHEGDDERVDRRARRGRPRDRGPVLRPDVGRRRRGQHLVRRAVDAATARASPSRIVVARSAPATTSFVNTVGLPAAHDAGDAGQADDDDRQLAVEPGVRAPVRRLGRARGGVEPRHVARATRGPAACSTRPTATTPTTGRRRSP